MNSYNLPDFLPGSTNAEGRRRYALQELLCLRTACLKKPSGMQDYASDGQLMQCSLLDSSSDAFNWEQVAGSLQVGFLQGMAQPKLGSAGVQAAITTSTLQGMVTQGLRGGMCSEVKLLSMSAPGIASSLRKVWHWGKLSCGGLAQGQCLQA